jgi:hypothetical protein
VAELFFLLHFLAYRQVPSFTTIDTPVGIQRILPPGFSFVFPAKTAKISTLEGGVSMESDFFDIINEIMCLEDDDLPNRLEEQEEALAGLTCTNPTLGKWFEKSSVSYVIAAFNLSDKDFAAQFPHLRHVTSEQRKEIVDSFQKHISNCPRCGRRSSYDLEFEKKLEANLMRNKEVLMSHLHYDDPDKPTEENHKTDLKAQSAHR